MNSKPNLKRRLLMGWLGLSPLTLLASKMPKLEKEDSSIADILINRWEKSRSYTMAVLDAMPLEDLEFRPSPEQMSFAQHFLHIGYTNNMFLGVLKDEKTYADFNVLKDAPFFFDLPDPVSVFNADSLQKRSPEENKAMIVEYLNETHDYVLANLKGLKDDFLKEGREKVKPWYLEGHTHLDLILRAENHTVHHRAQAVSYLRMKGIQPPGYSKHNTL
ncbi:MULTISPECIES: DinB family protein [Maribacter]|uniref:DinB family protein n=1 Tax=Maribacter flavus TaxID=1658664 RepID=A0ABU7IJV2_9FLAO|nr:MULTISPECIES: DinB family protein [Maribacter]MDC6405976.1 DinB family protein [Maribacter sp. PR66]MEE1973239.1 DinB family protein [Maribacter flavus]